MDSQTVLYWLYGNKRLTQFMNNRVQKVKQLFPESLWGYCPKSNNPADLLTRRMTTIQLTSSFFWWHGPTWLTSEHERPSWSVTISHTITAVIATAEFCDQRSIISSRKTQTTNTQNQPIIHRLMQVSSYSSLNKLLRITAYVLRFITVLISENRITYRLIYRPRTSTCWEKIDWQLPTPGITKKSRTSNRTHITKKSSKSNRSHPNVHHSFDNYAFTLIMNTNFVAAEGYIMHL